MKTKSFLRYVNKYANIISYIEMLWGGKVHHYEADIFTYIRHTSRCITWEFPLWNARLRVVIIKCAYIIVDMKGPGVRGMPMKLCVHGLHRLLQRSHEEDGEKNVMEKESEIQCSLAVFAAMTPPPPSTCPGSSSEQGVVSRLLDSFQNAARSSKKLAEKRV